MELSRIIGLFRSLISLNIRIIVLIFRVIFRGGFVVYFFIVTILRMWLVLLFMVIVILVVMELVNCLLVICFFKVVNLVFII